MAVNVKTKIYSNDGTTLLFTAATTSSTDDSGVVTATGFEFTVNYGASTETYTYSGNQTFLGLASSANATEPEWAIGDTISPLGGGLNTFYIVEVESSTPTLTYDLTKLNLAAGTYNISIVAKAEGYKDSVASEAVEFVVGSIGYTLTSEDLTYDDHDNYFEAARATLADGSIVNVYSNQTIENVVSVEFTVGMESTTQHLYRMPPTATQTLLEIDEDTTVILTADMLYEDTNMSFCILGDSIITMADDTTKEFKDIVVGDEVKFYDFEQKQWRSAVVTWFHMVHPNGTKEDQTLSKQMFYNEYTFEDGTIIKTAMRHRFYNVEQQAFVYMPLWNIGEHTLKDDGTEIALVSVRRVEVDTPITYCQMKFENESYVNFIANGCITGDRRCPTPVTFD